SHFAPSLDRAPGYFAQNSSGRSWRAESGNSVVSVARVPLVSSIVAKSLTIISSSKHHSFLTFSLTIVPGIHILRPNNCLQHSWNRSRATALHASAWFRLPPAPGVCFRDQHSSHLAARRSCRTWVGSSDRNTAAGRLGRACVPSA